MYMERLTVSGRRTTLWYGMEMSTTLTSCVCGEVPNCGIKTNMCTVGDSLLSDTRCLDIICFYNVVMLL